MSVDTTTFSGLTGCIALAFSLAVPAATLSGLVVGVHDGDTIIVLDAERQQHKVRLAGIDAPEGRQPFGTRSRQHLAGLVYRQSVNVEWSKVDRYGRIVGKVLTVAPCLMAPCPLALDANLAQITAGMAWHYKEYEREQLPADRAAYAHAEKDARDRRAGIWADGDAIPPWEWRHAKQRRQPQGSFRADD